MSSFTYQSGDEVRAGDRILYHGQPGEVEFVVATKSGDPALDWYLDQYPGGGFMITAVEFGSVFLTADNIDDDLQFVSRGVP
jgi:hypothetical protein